MNELVKVGNKTYYVSGPFHVGVYVLDKETHSGKKQVCLIDSGVDSTVAKVIDKLLIENNFFVKCIINTHYHADHSGGNSYFKEKYNCQIMATKINAALIANYDICPSIVWGAVPINAVLNNYFYATPTEAVDIDSVELPEGLELIGIPGHCIDMIAVRTSDDVLFVGDGVVSKETLDKHPLTYLYDVGEHLKTLEKLKRIKASLYIGYHVEPVKRIKPLVDANMEGVYNNINAIKQICSVPRSIDEIISIFFTQKGFKLSMYKYAVEGGIIKTYVTYLYNKGELTAENIDNYIKWKVKE